MIEYLSGTAQLIGAGVLVFNCWLTYNNGERAKGIKNDVADIKEQTNGMSSHLVKLTGESEFAKGLKQGEDNPK